MRPYIRTVLFASAHNLDALRVHLAYLFESMMEVLGRRNLLDERAFEGLRSGLKAQINGVATEFGLLMAFDQAIKDLTGLLMAPARGSLEARLAAAKQYVDRNLRVDLSLGDVAKESGFSKDHFSVRFKDYVGKTFQKYLLHSRLELACRLLTTSVLPVNQVSLEAGFGSNIYFHRAFKKAYGCPPQDFRAGKRA